ncbi:MAG TPA: hypothetical protein VF049_08160 [Nocardioidaceae bacterium]|jgi:hypothetical protein
MTNATPKLGRVSTVALATAVVWALVLVVSAFLVPVYTSISTSSSGKVTRGSDTLVGMNGWGGALVVAVPLLVTLLVAGALLLRPRRAAMASAWVFTALLCVFNLLAIMTVGLFMVPVTAALVVACAATSVTGAAVTA